MDCLVFKIIFVELLYIFSYSNASFIIRISDNWMLHNSNGSITVNGSVPGDVYLDLFKSGIIADPYVGENDVKLRWISKESWTYKCIFQVTHEVLSANSLIMEFEGVDTVSKVSVNGITIGHTSNMFVRYLFNVKNVLHDGWNALNVTFESPVQYAQNRSSAHSAYPVPPACPLPVQNGECHVNFIRKAQYTFSWDWGPAYPTSGLWKSVNIYAFNSSYIEYITANIENGTDGWIIYATVYFHSAIRSDGVLSIALPQLKVKNESKVNLKPGKENITLTIQNIAAEHVILWWPNGYGRQKLYTLEVNFTQPEYGNNKMEHKTIQIGFRSVELIQDKMEDGGLSFYFKINGFPLFMKGTNWIPADSFLSRVTTEKLQWLLESMAAANMNIIRVWGGGLYESDMFYDLADKLGIMVWQDIMFACAMYPTDKEFLKSVSQEVLHQSLRLQYHTSIIVWSGNNENEAALSGNWYQTQGLYKTYKSDYVKLYVEHVYDIVKQIDALRPFLFSSPTNGVESEREGFVARDPSSILYGDMHYYNYLSDGWDWHHYPTPRFTSEYGFQSWPLVESLKPYSQSPDTDFGSCFLTSPFLSHHQHHLLGNEELLLGISRHFPLPPQSPHTVEYTLYLTQIYQAVAVQTETEYYRRLRATSHHTMGAMYWQLNDVWPGASWSSIDYTGRWKILHNYATKFFSPLLPSPYIDGSRLSVSIISDKMDNLNNLTLNLDFYTLKNKFSPVHHQRYKNLTIPRLNVTNVFNVSVPSLLKPINCSLQRGNCFIIIYLTNPKGLQIGSKNVQWFLEEPLNPTVLPSAQVSVKSVVQSVDDKRLFKVAIESTDISLYVTLTTSKIKGRWSDNGFLIYQPSLNLTFTLMNGERNITANYLKNNINIITLQKVYRT